ncbi:trigger factor, partial [Candidatus Eisenbacteria bacterium]
MKVEIEETGPCSRTMRVEASWDEVKADYSDVVKGFARVNVPGFRPGKAPRSIIEQRFAKDILEEVRDRCARRLGRKAMDENEISMAGIAEISDMEFQKEKGYTFKVEFNVIPEFELPAYSGLSLSKDADGDALRDEISRFLLENTQLELPVSLVDEEMEGDGVGADEPGYEEARKAAEARLKLMIILKRIARVDGIEVD